MALGLANCRLATVFVELAFDLDFVCSALPFEQQEACSLMPLAPWQQPMLHALGSPAWAATAKANNITDSRSVFMVF